MHETVAVIGLGAMGGRAAARFAEAGATVYGYDPATEARAAAAESRVVPCERIAELPSADVFVLSLPRPADVLAVIDEGLEGLPTSTVVVDLSTIDPSTARGAAERIGASGASYVDAPVLGRPDGCGNWTLPIGGSPNAVGRVRPLLEQSVAKWVAHIGEVGTGTAVKLLNNLMFGGINAVTAEAFNICRLAGVDPDTFAGVIADSGAATVSGLFRDLGSKIPAGDFSPTFGLGLLQKDNRLALAMAEEAGSPAFVAHCVDQLNTLTARQGWAGEDTAAVYRLYELLSSEHGR